jgi:hypothetical protein
VSRVIKFSLTDEEMGLVLAYLERTHIVRGASELARYAIFHLLSRTHGGRPARNAGAHSVGEIMEEVGS